MSFQHPPELSIIARIAVGGYGEVVKAVHIESGEMLAIKRVRDYSKHLDFCRKICREVAILAMLNDPTPRDNIVPLYNVYLSEDKRDVHMVFPFIDHDLCSVVEQMHLNEAAIQQIAKQILSGLKHCHDSKILHRDLTLRNCLIDNDSNLVIADFGLARTRTAADEEGTVDVIALPYRAPELLLRFGHAYGKYDERLDIWSVGTMICELFLCCPNNCRHLFFECAASNDNSSSSCNNNNGNPSAPRDEFVLLKNIVQLCGPVSEEALCYLSQNRPEVISFIKQMQSGCSKNGAFSRVKRMLEKVSASAEAVDLISKMLRFDWRERIIVDEALNHPFFSKVFESEEEQENETELNNNNNNNDIEENDVQKNVQEEQEEQEQEENENENKKEEEDNCCSCCAGENNESTTTTRVNNNTVASMFQEPIEHFLERSSEQHNELLKIIQEAQLEELIDWMEKFVSQRGGNQKLVSGEFVVESK